MWRHGLLLYFLVIVLAFEWECAANATRLMQHWTCQISKLPAFAAA